MSFSSRIKERREELGLSRNELADKLNCSPSAISNYENGISFPKVDLLFKIFDALKCDANYLYQDEMQLLKDDFIVNLKERQTIIKYRKLDERGKKSIDCILDDLYYRCINEQEVTYTVLKPNYLTGLSAGTGLYVFDDVPSEQIEVPIEFKDIDFVINVTGDSMEPYFIDGDKVMIKKQNVNIGDVGAFMYKGEAYIKKLGNKKLISTNDSYPDLIIDENSQFEVIGKVIGKL